MDHAADLGHALLEAVLVAGEVVADQFALPVAQEAARMLTGPTRPEVVDHGLEVGEGAGCIGPDVSPLGLLRARGEHLHRGFVGEDDVLLEQAVAQGIDQRLQLDTASADPLR
ncbi:hypothetical protein HMPREF1487_09375 [Pseudomonas sp. HPB0071]|nr:hypothetical protein HMPREF1487_09351 [Pseudomonas sp. HPB0071]ENA27162.1 hypothetical protein HMPREF1487_09375 [Pseudomonas sp. HPB0071]